MARQIENVLGTGEKLGPVKSPEGREIRPRVPGEARLGEVGHVGPAGVRCPHLLEDVLSISVNVRIDGNIACGYRESHGRARGRGDLPLRPTYARIGARLSMAGVVWRILSPEHHGYGSAVTQPSTRGSYSGASTGIASMVIIRWSARRGASDGKCQS